VRFLISLWLLILGSLILFSLLLFSNELFGQDVPVFALKLGLLAGSWMIGIASAAAIHLLYRRAESALQDAARDQTVVQLAGAVAHELNQPLTVLISSGELMRHHDKDPEEMKVVALRMVDASERVSDIVEKLQRATHYRSKEYAGGIRIVDLDRAG
jgi:signal transduction histidine kinase